MTRKNLLCGNANSAASWKMFVKVEAERKDDPKSGAESMVQTEIKIELIDTTEKLSHCCNFATSVWRSMVQLISTFNNSKKTQ